MAVSSPERPAKGIDVAVASGARVGRRELGGSGRRGRRERGCADERGDQRDRTSARLDEAVLAHHTSASRCP